MSDSELRQVHHGWVRELCCQVTLDLPITPDEFDETDLDPPFFFGCEYANIPDGLPGKDIRAVFDTGATQTFVSQWLADAIGLEYITSEPVGTPDGDVESGVYYASLWLPNGIVFPFMRIGDMEGDRDDLLIGMDIIGQSNFSIVYDGTRHETTFSFHLLHSLSTLTRKGLKYSL